MRRPSRLFPVYVSVITTDLRSPLKEKSPSYPLSFPGIDAFCLWIIFALVLISHAAFSQHMNARLTRFFADVRDGNNPPLPEMLHAEAPLSVFTAIQPWLHDSIESVAAKAAEMVHLLGSQALTSGTRKHAVALLLAAYHSKHHQLNGRIFRYLTQYAAHDFTDASRHRIRTLVKAAPPYLDRLHKLAGFLNLTDLIPHIRLWSKPGNPPEIRWAAYLSLARMGDPHAIAEIEARVSKLPVNDDVVYGIFPALRYTRRHELIRHMITALHSTSNDCLSADAEKETPIPCGYRIMEQLAGIVIGYPFATDESGDLDTDDYPEALEATRTWFLEHENYQMRNDIY